MEEEVGLEFEQPSQHIPGLVAAALRGMIRCEAHSEPQKLAVRLKISHDEDAHDMPLELTLMEGLIPPPFFDDLLASTAPGLLAVCPRVKMWKTSVLNARFCGTGPHWTGVGEYRGRGLGG